MKITLKQKKKLKKVTSKVELKSNHCADYVNGLINLENKNRLHLLPEILLIRELTK